MILFNGFSNFQKVLAAGTIVFLTLASWAPGSMSQDKQAASPPAAKSSSDASSERLIDFHRIQGTWTGFGWFEFGVAERQRAKCKALITADGGPKRGSLNFSCASDEYKFGAKAFDIVFDGTSASGKWSLLEYEMDGSLSGKISEDGFSVSLKPVAIEDGDYGATMNARLENKCRALLDISIQSPLDIKKIKLNVVKCYMGRKTTQAQ